MAPLPEIADTYRVAFNWNYGNVCYVCHFHAATLQSASLATLIQSNVKVGMWNSNSNAQWIESFDVTPLDGFSATYRRLTDGSAKWKGSQAGDYIPGVAMVISKHTVARGASHRGRSFIGPVGEAALNNGLINDTVRANAVTDWTAFQVGVIAGGAEEVVASYVHAEAFTIVNYSVRPAAGTQRRRQDRLAHV